MRQVGRANRDWIEILLVPFTLAVVGVLATYVVSERERLTSEEQARATLVATYSEIWMAIYAEAINDPVSNRNARSLLMTAAQWIEPHDPHRKDELMALTQAAIPRSVSRGVETPRSGFESRESYAGSCRDLPAAETCAAYSDGYVWRVEDSIAGWREERTENLQIAIGMKAQYYHVLGTTQVKREPW